MAQIDIFVSKHCPHCVDLKEEIADLKSSGKLNCPINYIELEKRGNERIFDQHNVQQVPTIMVNGEEMSLTKLRKLCR